jgi:NADPH:quinone reductase-like Zn-dependent oxidoreductase
MLVTLGKVAPGQSVLVLGAGSGVGTAGIQIAKLFGARVIATASGDEKCRKALALGADEAIDHSSEGIYHGVRRLTRRRGVDIVFEHVGQVTWPDSLRSLTPGGKLVTCGATTGPFGETDIRYIFSRQLQVLGSYMGSRAELLALMPHFASGVLRPVVDRVFTLAEAREAHAYLAARRHFGKVMLAVG